MRLLSMLDVSSLGLNSSKTKELIICSKQSFGSQPDIIKVETADKEYS